MPVLHRTGEAQEAYERKLSESPQFQEFKRLLASKNKQVRACAPPKMLLQEIAWMNDSYGWKTWQDSLPEEGRREGAPKG